MKPKYTKIGNRAETFKGWNRTGIKIFNKLVSVVKANRLCSESKEMEVELKLIYAKPSNSVGWQSTGYICRQGSV